jgi:hypothetical protein
MRVIVSHNGEEKGGHRLCVRVTKLPFNNMALSLRNMNLSVKGIYAYQISLLRKFLHKEISSTAAPENIVKTLEEKADFLPC